MKKNNKATKHAPEVINVTGQKRAAVRAAAAVLKSGGLVVMPTDTVYGVACIPGKEARIYRAKVRDRKKPIPLLVSGMCGVARCGGVMEAAEKELARKFWPGPLTLVLNLRGGGTEGFRIPRNKTAMEVIRRAGGALRVTSANMSGQPPALTAKEAIDSLGHSVDLVLDGGRIGEGVPSTVVRVVDGRPKILRKGALSRKQCLNL